MANENETLATELLHELKATSKRWFIAFLVVLVLWFATIGTFIWYLTLPAEEGSYSIDQNASGRSFNIVDGTYNNGSKSND